MIYLVVKKGVKKQSKSKKASKAKKTTKKKVPSKKASKTLSINKKVSDDKAFFLIDGTTIYSLKELVNVFDRMSDDIYYYHVTNDRNDFSNWVKDVIRDDKLAEQLIGAQGPMKAQCIILKYLLKW